MNWIEIVLAVFFTVASALAGAVALLQRAEAFCREEARYGLPKGNAPLIGAILGGLAGLCAGALLVYFTFSSPAATSWIEWAGRGSYVLIVAASAGHINLIVHLAMRLFDEETQLEEKTSSGGPQAPTLTVRRRSALRELSTHHTGADLRSRDDEVVEDLIGVLGDRLIDGQRALSRLPFYGYLGTVCGILLMANELTRLDEATESFKVLRDMADGLVLAFQTTLVALVAYLPLRKAMDMVLSRLGQLERAWLAMREET